MPNLPELPRGARLTKITAAHTAAWNDAARAEAGRKVSSTFGVGKDEPTSVRIKVQNDSGAALDRFSVVRVAGPVIDADANLVEFQNNLAMKVDAPGAAADRDVIAVLLQPLADQKIGRAIIAGEIVAKVFVDTGETAWEYADVTSGVTDYFVMKETAGCAKVLWKQSGTGGEKWAVIVLGDFQSGSGGSTNSFETIAVSGQSNVVADSSTDTLTLVGGTGITITTNATTDTITIATAVAYASDAFKTISVSGQADVVADSATDTLTLVAGTNITITTNAGTDTITINSTGATYAFSTIAVSGQANVVADVAADTLTLVAGTGVTITTDAGTDTITINAATQNVFSTIAVSGQSNVVADSTTDTLTFAAGSNVEITTDATTDTVTIATNGYTGTITHYRYTWDSETCVMTETSQAITVSEGVITAVGSWA